VKFDNLFSVMHCLCSLYRAATANTDVLQNLYVSCFGAN